MDYSNKMLGKNIRTLRKKRNLSIDELSQLIGISPSFLGLIERGQRGLSIDNLCRICNMFNIQLDELIYGENRKNVLESESCNNVKVEKIINLLVDFNQSELDFILDILISLDKNIKA